jgi:hypothetical protein
MPLVDSKQQMLQVGELLTIASENTESEYPPEFLYATFVKEVQMPDSKFLRYGNTLYLIHGSPQDPRKGQFRALNADTAENFLQSGFQFVIDAYKAGYDVLVTEFKDQSLLNIFRTVSRTPPNPGMGYQVEMTQDNQYRVTLQLGTSRQGVR